MSGPSEKALDRAALVFVDELRRIAQEETPAPGATGNEGLTPVKEIEMNDTTVPPEANDSLVSMWLQQFPELPEGDPRRDEAIAAVSGEGLPAPTERSDLAWGAVWVDRLQNGAGVMWPLPAPTWAAETDVTVESDVSGYVTWNSEILGQSGRQVWLTRDDVIDADKQEYVSGDVEVAIKDDEATVFYSLTDVDEVLMALLSARMLLTKAGIR